MQGTTPSSQERGARSERKAWRQIRRKENSSDAFFYVAAKAATHKAIEGRVGETTRRPATSASDPNSQKSRAFAKDSG
jgi:hypothetical protein